MGSGRPHSLYQTLVELQARHHRLIPSRRLRSVAEATRFVRSMGLVTLMPGSGLPSLFGAIHGVPVKPGGRGFATWPREQWWWGGAVAEARGILYVRILAGKGVFVARRLWPSLDAIARYVLAELDAGRYGRYMVAREAAQLLAYLRREGPTRTDVLRRALGYATPAEGRQFHRLKTALEALGVVVGRAAKLKVHLHVDVLHRWDQYLPRPPGRRGGGARAQAFRAGLTELLYAAVDAAVVVPEAVARRWFRWRVAAQQAALTQLTERGRLQRISGNGRTLLTSDRWVRESRA